MTALNGTPLITRPAPPQLAEVAQGVFSYVQPDGTWFINNCGFVVGEGGSANWAATGSATSNGTAGGGVISIDSTSTEARNRAYLAAIAQVTDQPVKVLVNTHHHADHTNGNCLFEDATVVAHTSCRDVMVATGLADYSAVFPGVEWGELAFRPPDVTFEESLTLYAGDVAVELRSLGYVAHTEGDVLAWVPSRGVLFTGDLIFHGGTPFALFGSISGTIAALDDIAAYDAAVVVPGHGPAFGTPPLGLGSDAGFVNAPVGTVLDAQRAYLEFVQQAATDGVAAGRTPLEQATRADLGPFSNLTDPERLAGNLHVAYREAGCDEHWDSVAGAIADMVRCNGGAMPHCLA